jgi:hypothetical protein
MEKTTADIWNEYEETVKWLQSEASHTPETPEMQAHVLREFIRTAALQAKKTGVRLAEFQEMCGEAFDAVNSLDTDFSRGFPTKTRTQ